MKALNKELNRKKKKSKGRQKVPIPLEKKSPCFGKVALLKKEVKRKKKVDTRGEKLGSY